MPHPDGSEFVKERGSEVKYTWKVIHEVVGKLEEALNGLQKDETAFQTIKRRVGNLGPAPRTKQ